MVKVMSLKDFKKDYQFNLKEEIATLQKIMRHTFNNKLRAKAGASLARLTNAKRPAADKDLTIKLSYVLTYESFMKYKVDNIDYLYNIVEKTDNLTLEDLRRPPNETN